MASIKKSREAPAVPAEIFYFSDAGEGSTSPAGPLPAADVPMPRRAVGAPESAQQGQRPPLPSPPPLSKLAERVGRSERTRAAKASSLKGAAQARPEMPALKAAAGQRAPAWANAPDGADGDWDLIGEEVASPQAFESAEKTEACDLPQMPIADRLDASDRAEAGLEADDVEEIEPEPEPEPESTLVEDLSAESEAANVEAEFARALEAELLAQPAAPAPARPPLLTAVADSRASQHRAVVGSGSAAARALPPMPEPPGEGLLANAAICLLKSAQAQQHYRQKLAPLLTQGSPASPRRTWASAALFAQDLFTTGRPLPAQKVLERLVAQAPAEAFPYAMLASLHLAQGDEAQALQLYDQALEIDSTDLCALLGRAEIHLRAAEPGAALVDVKTALNQAALDESPLLLRAQAMLDAVQKLLGFLG